MTSVKYDLPLQAVFPHVGLGVQIYLPGELRPFLGNATCVFLDINPYETDLAALECNNTGLDPFGD